MCARGSHAAGRLLGQLLRHGVPVDRGGGCRGGCHPQAGHSPAPERGEPGAQLIEYLSAVCPPALKDKHKVIGDARGKGLFLGAELVSDRSTKEPAPEKMCQAVVADCMAQGIVIGMTNRSLPGLNNTLCFSPALIATKDDIDEILTGVDKSLTKVFG